MSTTLLPLSAYVDDIVDLGHDHLTPVEAGSITGRARNSISEACARGEIEAHFTCARGRGRKHRWTFTRAALLVYVWKNTSGDKALMREALTRRAPHLLAFLEPQPAQPAALPQNVIPISSARRATRPADPLAGMIGDLFSHQQVG